MMQDEVLLHKIKAKISEKSSCDDLPLASAADFASLFQSKN